MVAKIEWQRALVRTYIDCGVKRHKLFVVRRMETGVFVVGCEDCEKSDVLSPKKAAEFGNAIDPLGQCKGDMLAMFCKGLCEEIKKKTAQKWAAARLGTWLKTILVMVRDKKIVAPGSEEKKGEADGGSKKSDAEPEGSADGEGGIVRG